MNPCGADLKRFSGVAFAAELAAGANGDLRPSAHLGRNKIRKFLGAHIVVMIAGASVQKEILRGILGTMRQAPGNARLCLRIR